MLTALIAGLALIVAVFAAWLGILAHHRISDVAHDAWRNHNPVVR